MRSYEDFDIADFDDRKPAQNVNFDYKKQNNANIINKVSNYGKWLEDKERQIDHDLDYIPT